MAGVAKVVASPAFSRCVRVLLLTCLWLSIAARTALFRAGRVRAAGLELYEDGT